MVSTKILINLFINILVLYIILGISAYFFATDFIINNATTNNKKYMSEINHIIESDLDDIVRYANIIKLDEQMTKVLNGNLLGSLDNEKYLLYNQLINQLSTFNDQKDIIHSMILIDKESGYYSYHASGYMTPFRLDIENFIKEKQWYKQMEKNNKRFIWFGFQELDYYYLSYDNKRYFSFAISVPNANIYPNFDSIGTMLFILDRDYISSKLDYLVAKNSLYYIIDQKSNLLAYKGPLTKEDENVIIDEPKIGEKVDLGEFTKELGQKKEYAEVFVDEQKYYVINYSSEKYGISHIQLIPKNNLLLGQRQMIKMMLSVLFLGFLIFALVIVIEVNNTLRPLHSLAQTIESVTHGRVDERYIPYSDDEIGVIGIQFNQMLDELSRTNLEKHMHEFSALQAQINPHFLYNTLNTIKMLAIQQGNTEINVLTKHIVRLLRATIGKEGEFITINEEVSILKDYLEIQKKRYGGKIEVFYNIEKEAGDCEVFKLILQPIIENCIFYAQSNKEKTLIIKVSAKIKGERVVITINDNGEGMSQEKINNIFNRKYCKNKFSSIGIVNIDQRIKLHYGYQYGVKVESEINKGTMVTIEIEARHEGEHYENFISR